MSIISSKHRMVKVEGIEYSAGVGIDITDHIISNTGANIPYSAGENIDIQDHIISGRDWTTDIANASSYAFNEATAQIPPAFDPTYISGQIDNKLDTTAFSTVSSTFLTAHQDISNKLDTTAFSTVSGTFLTAVDLTPYYTTADANTLSSMLSGAIDYVSANAGDEFPASADEAIIAYQTNSGTYLTAHQDLSYISGQIDNKLDLTAFNIPDSASWNESTNVVQNNSAAWFDNVGDAEVNNFVYDNSATINDVNTSYIQNSGTFLTAHQIIPSAKWEDASDVVQSNSAQWSENTGDEEVNNAVYNNSAKWNDIEVYQTNSGTYLTAHQDLSYISGQIDNKADISLVETVSGNITAIIPSTAGLATTAEVNTVSSFLSGAVDYVSANAGTTYTGVAPIVVNGDTISADSFDLNIGEGLALYNDTLYVSAEIPSAFDPTYLEELINEKLDTSAFSDVSGNFLTAHQDLSEYLTKTSADTLYQPIGSYAYQQDLINTSSTLKNDIDYVSANLPVVPDISAAEWNSVYNTVDSNSAVWETVTSKQEQMMFSYVEI